MSQLIEVPIKTLVLEHPPHYAHSALDVAKLRESAIWSTSLRDKLQHQCSVLKLDSRYIDELSVADFVAKTYNIGVHYTSTDEEARLWMFAATWAVFIFQFDDQFDQPRNTPENLSRLSMDLRLLIRALSRHGLSGLQGELEDWPNTIISFRKAYLWVLREGENLRTGTAELTHYVFLDYLFGVEVELMEWAPDVYRGDTTAWNLDRCNAVRKVSAGFPLAVLGPFYVANKWLKKEHITSCNDLLYDGGIIVGLGNDLLGVKKDQKKDEIGLKTIKIASANEIAQEHNMKVEHLRKDIQALNGDTRKFMEEVEASIAGLFLWQINAKRYTSIGPGVTMIK